MIAAMRRTDPMVVVAVATILGFAVCTGTLALKLYLIEHSQDGTD